MPCIWEESARVKESFALIRRRFVNWKNTGDIKRVPDDIKASLDSTPFFLFPLFLSSVELM